MLTASRVSLFLTLTHGIMSQGLTAVPDYVFTYAPLIYLDVNEQYYPSDIGAQITNTYPAINFTEPAGVASDLSLSNLASLNQLGGCDSFGNCDVYLTTRELVTPKPPSPEWLYGVLPNPTTGETEGATSCVVILRDHGNNTVDAFYMYFYAFNQGIPVGDPNGTTWGNHVGDWEHNMVRFVNGEPLSVWYSQHSNGEAYTYDAVQKNGSRPLGFASKGGHATYAQDGTHSMYANLANDATSRGPIWDPVAGSGAWYYSFVPNTDDMSNGTFTAIDVEGRTARGTGPTNWFYFLGKWGDQKYNASYPGQASIASLVSVFEDGPTGPLDKELARVEVCPSTPCSTRTTVIAATGTTIQQTVSRTYTSAPTNTVSTLTSPLTSPTGTRTGTGTGNAGGSGNAVQTQTPVPTGVASRLDAGLRVLVCGVVVVGTFLFSY